MGGGGQGGVGGLRPALLPPHPRVFFFLYLYKYINRNLYICICKGEKATKKRKKSFEFVESLILGGGEE